MKGKRHFVIAAVVAVVVVLLIVIASSGGSTTGGETTPASTMSVERGDLSRIVSVAGTLGYRAGPDGALFAAINQASGTFTDLPAVGTRVDCGDVLYRVDEKPVLMLCGRIPAYRALGVGDRGGDVRQINANLHELGYDDKADVDVDPDSDAFTEQTAAALRELQARSGLGQSGELGLADAVFLPDAVRIAKVDGQIGGAARPSAPVAEATTDIPEVQVSLDPSQGDGVKRGDGVEVTLPDNVVAKGRVERIGQVTQSGKESGGAVTAATVPAYIRLDRPGLADGFDGAAIQADVTTKGVSDALTVPVTALVGKSGGGFAVEVVGGDGERSLVGVDLGLFDSSRGRVAVSGDVQPGERVVVPSL